MSPPAARLPALWQGSRRRLLVALALTGAGQAVVAAATAALAPRLLRVETTDAQLWLAAGLVTMALVLGVLRAMERFLGERLGQHYVHQIRMHLVRAALVGRGPSVGITVARTTNDLTSVRNWVVLGVVPLLVGIPTVVGAVLALAALAPALAVALLLAVGVLAAVLQGLAPRVRHRTAALRRQRGRLAAHVTDTVQAAETIVVAGGAEREVRRLAEHSRQVGQLAVDRAQLSGIARGAAASLATAAMVVVGAVGAVTGVDAATIATAFVIVGMVAAPVTDFGRVSEYRQSFRVAEQILGPQIQLSQRHRGGGRSELPVRTDPRGLVHLAELWLGGRPAPELIAHPGEVIVPRSAEPAKVRDLLRLLAHPEEQRAAVVTVAGHDLAEIGPRTRRELVGHAAAGLPIERGTVARAVRYRLPDAPDEAAEMLAEVGLTSVVDALPKGQRTQLRRGGEPLTAEQRARLQLARAWYGDPPLVVLDNIDRAMGAEGRSHFATGLRRRAGVTLLVSERPDELAPHYRVWDLDRAPGHHHTKGAGR